MLQKSIEHLCGIYMTLSFISTEKERLLIIVTDERSHLKSSLSVIGEQIIKGVAAHSDISAECN